MFHLSSAQGMVVSSVGSLWHGQTARFGASLDLNAKTMPVLDDVLARLRSQPLVPADGPIHGYIYDVRSGRLVAVD